MTLLMASIEGIVAFNVVEWGGGEVDGEVMKGVEMLLN